RVVFSRYVDSQYSLHFLVKKAMTTSTKEKFSERFTISSIAYCVFMPRSDEFCDSEEGGVIVDCVAERPALNSQNAASQLLLT
ncbi:hypothetical protein AVEN_107376-1, partial [Araneus ventricosus]